MKWKTSEKRMKQNYKIQYKATPMKYNKQKTESHNLKMKWKFNEKLKNFYSNNSKPVKGLCKNSPTTSKDQT
jgi:hypothetical protein